MSSTSILVLNQQIFQTTLRADALLRLLPRGAYTTARSVGSRGVFEFETHVKRTAASCASLLKPSQQQQQQFPAIATEIGLRSRLATSMRLATQALRSQLVSISESTGSSLPDVKLTCLLLTDLSDINKCCTTTGLLRTYLGDISDMDIDKRLLTSVTNEEGLIVLHATVLPTRRLPPIKCVVAGAPRTNALAKDSEWVRARTSLEATKKEDVEEILLSDTNEGRVLEGTQTNVFALIDNVLYTAGGADVLEGTVRRLVIEVCKLHDIPIIFEAPKLGGIDTPKWSGAFLTSTSRLVLPINEIEYTDSSNGSIINKVFEQNELIDKIEKLVNQAVDSHCTNIL
jgi:branched-subunit amino acid aminotransferase/4-amino-4-deoxychorismate lyase